MLPNYLPVLARVGGIRVRSGRLLSRLKTIVERQGLSKTARLCAINRVTLKGYIRGRSMPLETACKLVCIERLYCYTDLEFCAGRGGRMNYTRLPRHLTPDLAYLIGALRDGYVGITKNKDYLVTYTGSDNSWLENINKTFGSLFDIALEMRSDSRGCQYLERSSKPILYFIAGVFDHPIGRQKRWPYPSILAAASSKNQWAHIAAIVDAEGHIRKPTESSRTVTISQTNVPFLRTLQRCLEKLGVETTTYADHRRVDAQNLRIVSSSLIRFLENYLIYTQYPRKKTQAQSLLSELNKRQP